MNILSATFVKGVVDPTELFKSDMRQIAFIGRSNVGKSSTINALTKQKNLAKTSSFPGRTQKLNVFLINNKFYLVDLPGYGFARASSIGRENFEALIGTYLFETREQPGLVVLIIDALVGPTESDLEMLKALEYHKKNLIIVLNKIDKVKKAAYKKHLENIKKIVGQHKLIPFSAEKKIGIGELADSLGR